MNKQMRAVIYARYSHQKQDKSFSIEEQVSACRQKAEFEKYDIVEAFIERATSAKDLNRAVLASLINFVCTKKNDIDAIYIYDISRLSRNAVDLGLIKRDFAKHGIVIRSVNGVPDDTLEGNMMQDVIARFAQYENELKGVKVKGGMYNRFKAGYALHTVRGYKWGKNGEGKAIIVPDDTFPIYQALWHKIRDEKLTIINATKYINKLLPASKSIQKSALSRMLENKIYYGVLEYDKYPEEVKALHKPMIDEDTYWQVREIITGRSRNNKTRNKVNPLYPLTKSLKCPTCDLKLTAAKSKGKMKYYEYYFCRDRSGCKYNQQVEDVHIAFKEKL
jgi:site-specific DNA recombinase